MRQLLRTGLLLLAGWFLMPQVQAQPVSFQKAVPVWIAEQQTTPNLTASFRAMIPWNGDSDMQLRITAHSDYRAYVNGTFLGHGP